MQCLECYSENPRITPLLEPENCLKNHMQYICSKCGRCICIDHDEKRDVYRWSFPFKTLEIAKLYLKTAEIVCEDICGIYEISSKGRKSYKIFHTKKELNEYIKKNPEKSCTSVEPVYISETYNSVNEEQIRRLNNSEVCKYLEEQNYYCEKTKEMKRKSDLDSAVRPEDEQNFT